MKDLIFASDRERELMLRLEGIQFFSFASIVFAQTSNESKSPTDAKRPDLEKLNLPDLNKNIQSR
jgi:hypothetical protein